MSEVHKDAPAFDFFPERFWFAVEGWPDSEIIRYWRLLGQQWMRDGLPADERELAAMGRGKLSERVLAKFPISEDGKRRNPFLETIRASQRERIAKRRLGAQITNAKRDAERSAKRPPERTDSDPAGDTPPPTTHHPPLFERDSQRARPTLEQARAVAGDIGVTTQEAEDWWHAREASEWMKGTGGGGTTPVGSNWRSDLKTYTNAMREQRAREAAKQGSHANTTHQRSNTGGLNTPGRYS